MHQRQGAHILPLRLVFSIRSPLGLPLLFYFATSMQRSSAMENMIAVSGVTSVVVASVGLALWIEWVCLRGLLHLVRVPNQAKQSGRVSS
jgi:hypothetical protein